MNKKYALFLLSLIFICTIIYIPINLTLATQEKGDACSAIISDSSDYSDSVYLTTDGIELSDWEYNESKYLKISPYINANTEYTYTISVELPKELYIVGTELETPAGVSNVEFTKNENIEVNNGEYYEVKPYSGTILYTLDSTVSYVTIQLEIRYDETLWDKQANSIITQDGVNPISIKFSKMDADNNITQIEELSVKKATSSSGKTIAPHIYYLQSATTELLNQAITVSAENAVRLRVLFSTKTDNISWYYDKLVVNVNLPYYEDANGNKYYLEPDIDKMNLIAFSNPSYVIDSSTEGTITITIDKPYFSSGQFVHIYFKSLNEEILALNETSFVFKGGKIEAFANSITQIQNINVYSVNIKNITYETASYEEVVYYSNSSNGTVSILNKPDEAVARLGGFYLQNTGTKDSCSKEVLQEFDIENTNSIKVTTINLSTDRTNEYVDIEYTLVDDNGTPVYFDENGNVLSTKADDSLNSWHVTIKNNNYNIAGTHKKVMFSRNQLIDTHKNYFFKTIKYEISTIKASENMFTTNSKTDSGNFYGYVNNNVTSEVVAKSKMTLTSLDNDEIEILSKTVTTNFQNYTTNSPFFYGISTNKNLIQAGDSFCIQGELRTTLYPYGNATWLNDIVIGLVLPNGISVNEQGVTVGVLDNENITGISVTSKDLETGYTLWTIKYPANAYIGYYNENLSYMDQRNGISFNIQIDTDSALNSMGIQLASCLYATGINQKNVGVGEYAYTKSLDVYDLNENGLTDDYIVGINSSDTTTCQIIAKTDTLDINSSIILNTSGNIGEETDTVTLLNKDDIIIYNLDIKSSNGGIASDFEGYIPICKNISGRDAYLIQSDVNNSYNFSLQGPVTLTGNDIFTIQYTFEEGLTYTTAKNVTIWYNEEDIENDSTLLWENVTMIKITANSQVENLNDTRITLNLKYSGENYIQEVGLKNEWCSAFYYNYTNSDRITAGNYSTNKVSASISHTEVLPEITLTAAKNMTPKISENINEYTVSITQFKKPQNISITNVETYNVNLQNKEYIINNPDLSGADANTNFAVTTQLTNQTEKSILSSVSTTPILLGKIDANTTLEYKYKIYNANSLSDITQTRYIIVTLESDNGLILKQQININRELAEAENPQSSIIIGKNYILFDETNSNITITQNSALTTQYVIEHIPNNYNEKKISFSNNLPVNTKMVLINATDSENLLYWYYNVSSSINEIDLMDFLEMGKTSENNYNYPTGQEVIKEKYLLILDFSKCTEVIEGATTVKMIYSGENVSDFYSTELKFTQSAKRTFSLDTVNEESNFGKDITINYETIAPSASESNYTGKKLSLVINVPEELPIDSYIISNETNYYLNTNRQFIIPLNDVTEGSNSVTLNLNSKTLPLEATNYECTCELWVSATANGNSPLSGEKLAEQKINFANKEIPNPSLKVLSMDKRALTKDDLATQRTVVFDYKSAENCRIELELQQKDGTSYQKITNKLNKVNETTEHSNGIFAISAIDGNNTITCNLSSETDAGTYRFILRVKDENNNKLLEMPYNFIVLDE